MEAAKAAFLLLIIPELTRMNFTDYKSVSVITYKNTPCIQIKNANAEALLSLFGGHLLSFTPTNVNENILWLSEEAIFDEKTAIRGGVPICWPWFANLRSGDDIPAHGFVRSQAWQLIAIEEKSDAAEISETTLTLQPETLGLHNTSAHLTVRLVVTIAKDCKISLISSNAGNTPISITQALHSYFNVKDVTTAQIDGVTSNYYDKVVDTHGNTPSLPYKFESETDRIHVAEVDTSTNSQTVTIRSHNNFDINIGQSGHDSIIVWNPYVDKSKSMKDMADNGYETMLCIEAGNTEGTIVDAHSSVEISQWFSAKTR